MSINENCGNCQHYIKCIILGYQCNENGGIKFPEEYCSDWKRGKILKENHAK